MKENNQETIKTKQNKTPRSRSFPRVPSSQKLKFINWVSDKCPKKPKFQKFKTPKTAATEQRLKIEAVWLKG